MKHTRSIALLLRLDWGLSRALLRGITEYAHERGWHLYLGPPVPDILPLLKEWRVDGMIGYVPSKSFRKSLEMICPNLVSLSRTGFARAMHVVSADDDAIGEMAATHLIERGFRHFGFVGYRELTYSEGREAGFVRKVKEAGGTIESYHLATPSFGTFPKSLKAFGEEGLPKWLRQLPRPVGIMTCHDACGLQLAEVCRAERLAVPEQVAIVGVDDDESVCMLAWKQLSSVQLPAGRIGYAAGELLERVMKGKIERAREILFPPTQVITRHSSDVLGIDDEDVASAVRMIRQMGGKITVARLLKLVPVSRRTLEMKFRKLLGRSPLDEIQMTRIDAAKRLLAETDMQIDNIAQEAGFSSAKRFATVFKQRMNQSPIEFRERAQLIFK